MASKKAAKQTTATETPKPPTGIDFLKAAIADKPEQSVPQGMGLSISDPAISGATRKGKSSVVRLGADPAVLEDAREAASLTREIKRLGALFSVRQTKLRDYGADKRKVYNKVYKTDITTVDVPYTVEVAADDDSPTPGRETRYVQVVCSNKYSVSAEPVLAAKDEALKGWFDKLFNTEEEKVLKPDAEVLIRKILADNGLPEESMQKAMDLLFEKKVKVSTVESYEALEQEAPETVRAFLAQSVTRQQPSLKFPGE